VQELSTPRKRVALFYALTFLLLGAIPILHGLMASGPMNFAAAGARASAETGLAWTSNLLVMLRLCLAEPVLWLIVFGSAVPSIAALLVVAGNRSALASLLARLGPRIPWRRALMDYALIFALMIGGLVAVSMLRSFLPGPAYVRPENFVGPGLIVAVLAAAFLDQGAVLEELGWRGFAGPELQASRLSPLVAAIVVGIGWGLWHVPRDLTGGVVERLGVAQYLLLYLPSFLTGTVTVSIIAAYFVNRASGSVIPAIIVHGLGNDSVGISGAASMELALSPYHQATKALPFALLAVGILFVAGKSLGVARRRAV
jgi:hypothetical protein